MFSDSISPLRFFNQSKSFGLDRQIWYFEWKGMTILRSLVARPILNSRFLQEKTYVSPPKARCRLLNHRLLRRQESGNFPAEKPAQRNECLFIFAEDKPAARSSGCPFSILYFPNGKVQNGKTSFWNDFQILTQNYLYILSPIEIESLLINRIMLYIKGTFFNSRWLVDYHGSDKYPDSLQAPRRPCLGSWFAENATAWVKRRSGPPMVMDIIKY